MFTELLTQINKSRKSELEAYLMDIHRMGLQGAPSLEDARKDYIKSRDLMTTKTL